MKLINIGFGNFVLAERVISVLSMDSAPIKRMVSEAKETGRLVDASFGRKTKAVIITDSEHIVLSALTAEVLAGRMQNQPENNTQE